MTQLTKHIWYASYGSNLLEERFLCYIRGGQPVGSKKPYDGCRDKSLPVVKEEFYISSELYFAKESDSWDNGGVAFIKTNFEPKQSTFGRIYLITPEQFIDVVKQETNGSDSLHIDFGNAISEGSLIFKDPSWYGNLIYLGIQYDYPIFTFTNKINLTPTTKPSTQYLKTIISGIQEAFGNLNTFEILDYLISKEGIKENYSREELILIIEVKT
ncbi:MAG TPA: hypothetical protein VFG10_08430 [Saprospiraceae bacterium]|nr:hypothetical protein [Saprospiraceae bacterium]